MNPFEFGLDVVPTATTAAVATTIIDQPVDSHGFTNHRVITKQVDFNLCKIIQTLAQHDVYYNVDTPVESSAESPLKSLKANSLWDKPPIPTSSTKVQTLMTQPSEAQTSGAQTSGAQTSGVQSSEVQSSGVQSSETRSGREICSKPPSTTLLIFQIRNPGWRGLNPIIPATILSASKITWKFDGKIWSCVYRNQANVDNYVWIRFEVDGKQRAKISYNTRCKSSNCQNPFGCDLFHDPKELTDAELYATFVNSTPVIINGSVIPTIFLTPKFDTRTSNWVYDGKRWNTHSGPKTSYTQFIRNTQKLVKISSNIKCNHGTKCRKKLNCTYFHPTEELEELAK